MRCQYVLGNVLTGLLVWVAVCAAPGWGQVKTWEGTITIPTYPWGPEDLNPKFYLLEDSIIYPYTMQDQLSTKKVERVYKALFLENEYLKVTCLPELSGRLFSVLDKTTGEEMFHLNKVVKPGLIGMRGAWISGGVEWNTGPHGHTVTCVTPVDCLLQENKDGSATLVVGNIEQIFRTRWQIKVTLHPGKAYLDENIFIYNPMDGVHPYYFWNCTSFPCLPGTRFIYPMTLGTDHAGTSFFNWPINEGKDLTWLKNYDSPTSIFAYKCDFDFFGSYDVDLDRGIVQFANHNLLIGKKAWTWGQSESGLVSEMNLHEGKEQYIEVQSGPLLTQADYGLLKPRERVAWQEWWYPVHGLKDGFEYATRDVAVQTLRQDKSLEFRFIATGEFPEAQLTLAQDGKSLLNQKLPLSPKTAAKVELASAPDAPITVTIQNGSDILATFITPLPIPKVTPPERSWLDRLPEDKLTAEQKYFKGLLFDKQTNRPEARKWYEKTLAADPEYTPALQALAVLDLEAGLFDSAVQRLEKALVRNPDDGFSWYYLGTARLNQNDPEKAMACGYRAARMLTHAALGFDLVGRSLMKLGRYAEAVVAFQKSTALNPQDSQSANLELIALYANKNTDKASQAAQIRIPEDPTDLIPRAVAALCKSDLKTFAQESRKFVGEYNFEILDLVLVFVNVNQFATAAQLLQACSLDEKQPYPSALYLWAYLQDKLGDAKSAKETWAKAARASVDYVFPSQLEMIDVFRTAIAKNPKDAAAHLYLGNLFGGLGRMDEAKPEWQQAADLNPKLNVAWRNLGLAAWKLENNLPKAEELYRKAIAARPEDQTLDRDLAQILIADKKRLEAIKVMETMKGKQNRRIDIIDILAQAYLDEHRYTDTIELLDKSFFSNWENRVVSHNIFVRAHMERGKQYFEQKKYKPALADFAAALTYPEHLGVGRPADANESEQYYWKGKALAALNRLDEAKAAWKQGADSPRGHERRGEYQEKCKKELEK